jgi:hypothetical protein
MVLGSYDNDEEDMIQLEVIFMNEIEKDVAW